MREFVSMRHTDNNIYDVQPNPNPNPSTDVMDKHGNWIWDRRLHVCRMFLCCSWYRALLL